jgi:peptidoglycan/xylan/chitin deacetylase (PgdA/CDA1 family)
VLLHDTKRQTAQMLPALLRELKRRGYRVVHVVAAKT